MRDPWVMRDPDGDGWLMYFTARTPGGFEDPPNKGGVIGFATSTDLQSWTLEPPVSSGGAYGQMEVPQVFSVGQNWYCLFCNCGDHWSQEQADKLGKRLDGNHFLVSDNPRGPFVLPNAPFFDGATPPCERYAARIVKTDEERFLMGFKDGGCENFSGYLMDPTPVYLDAQNNLTFSAPPCGLDGGGE